MKGLHQLALVGALALASSAGVARAGGEHGVGGADDYRVVPAFFLSHSESTPVTACVEAARDFGFEKAVLEKMSEQAFQEWARYISDKKLDLGGSPFIQTRLEMRGKCRGDENLTYYFGVENDEVRRFKPLYSHPFGFAESTVPSDPWAFPRKNARGFVWIAPPNSLSAEKRIPTWNARSQTALYGLLLHEVGHVFGNSHVENTVMTPKLKLFLEEDTDPTKLARFADQYSAIDSDIELVPCMECRASYKPAETRDPIFAPGDPEGSDWLYTFRRLMGREPVGAIALRYERLGSPEGEGRLTIKDTQEAKTFPVAISNEGIQTPPIGPLFLGQGGPSIGSFGMVYPATIQSATGESIPVMVNYNMYYNKKGRRVVIKPVGQGSFFSRPFFVSAQ